MKLIFGGAYNGKLEFAKEKYDFKDEDIFFCKDESLNFTRRVVCGLHVFTQQCVLKNVNPLEIIKDNTEKLKDKIIICDEIGSGIVPLKKEDRMWREETGRVLQYLSSNADEVYRIFSGISEKIK